MVYSKQLAERLLSVRRIGRDLQEKRLIGLTEEDAPREKSQKAGDEIIEISLTTTCDQCARSGAGHGHADSEDQTSDQITQDIG